MKNALIVAGIVVSVLVLCPFAAHGTTFTLSAGALMSLDYDYDSDHYYPGNSSAITNITNVAGQGVKFDILCSDPLDIHGKVPSLSWTSCIYGGQGALTGLDISSYDSFALKITLLSAHGVSSPDAVGPLIVGALINQSQYVYAYQPQVIGIDDSNPRSAISVTTTDAGKIELIGFTCEIPYWWYGSSGPLGPSPWDPTGATISLFVQPAPGAVVITPEPATLLLLGLGAAIVRKRKG